MRKSRVLLVGICAALCAGCPRRDVARPDVSDGGAAGDPLGSSLAAIAQEQQQAELLLSPTTATWLGDHRYDDRLDEVRDVALRAEAARLRAVAERLRRLLEPGGPLGSGGPGGPVGLGGLGGPGGPGGAAAQRALDAQLLLGRVRAQLIELSDLRPAERSPLHYMNIVAFGIDGLLGPDFNEARVRPLVRRLKAVPDLCREAQRSLKSPPELSVRRAIELGQSTADFLGMLLPRLLRSVATDKLLDESLRTSDEARRALEDLVGWMGRDLLPRAKGEWSIGREMLVARLNAEELLDVPLERLLALGEREVRGTQARLEDAARQLAGPGAARPVEAALRLIEDDHPRAEELTRSVEETLAGLLAASAEAQLVPLPLRRKGEASEGADPGATAEAPGADAGPRSPQPPRPGDEAEAGPARPRLVEMPPYRWGYLLLSMPGPLETRPREAQLLVDPVDPAWTDKKRVQDHLRQLSRAQQLLLLSHEVVPGHFVQQELLRERAPSLPPVRQRARSQAFVAGWAHYAQGLLFQALPEGDQRDRLRALLLRAQLWRLGRLVVALRLHLGGGGGGAARLDDVAEYLSDECYLDDFAARREAERAALDPMVLLPALGRLQLEKLQRDYQAQAGERFSLKEFHAALLRQGELPVVALRQLLLKSPGPSLELP